MSPQNHLYDLFLADTYHFWRTKSRSAVETVMRLRLYLCTTEYTQSLRDLFLKGGFSEQEYDRLLSCYVKECCKKDTRHP